jgi:hypothetical protein
MTPNVTELRLQLRAAGFDPIPDEGKRPAPKAWEQKTNTNAEEIALWERTYHLATNTGILAKFAPGLDIDIMDADAAETVEELAREHFEQRGDFFLVRFGLPPKRLVPLRTDEPFAKLTRLFTAPNGNEHKIEILCDGQQWVAFGIHPDTGKPYGWHGGNLGTIRREDLPYVRREDMEKFLDEAVELLIRKHGYQHGSERPKPDPGSNGADWGYLTTNILAGRELHDSLLVLAGKLVTSGMGAGAAINFLRGLMEKSTAPHDVRWRDRYRDIPRLVESAKQPQPQPTTPLFDPWQEFIVPEFPLDILPSTVCSFVENRAVAMGIDPAAAAMATLATLSGAIHHRFRIKMKRQGNWTEHVRLWVLLVGRPAWKKTPLINGVTWPLEYYQADVMRDYRARMREYEATGSKDDPEPEPPVRYVVNDITIEKLGDLMSRSPRGMFAKLDELAGWIGRMERYHTAGKGASADRAFWLQAWNGGHYTVDRVHRGEVFIENLSISVLGGIQPARLSEIHGLTSDGLLQRFLPVLMRAPVLPRDIDCGKANHDYKALIYKLIETPPQELRTTTAALEVMDELQACLFNLEQVGEAVSDGFEGFIGKLATYAGVFTIILHLADNPKQAVENFIGRELVQKVDRLVRDFLLRHAWEFYSVGEGETERLRRLASYILTCGRDRLRLTDITSGVRECRGRTVIKINQQVSPLVAGGWLSPAEQGPACRAWDVNRAGIDARFAERARIEEERKLAIRQLIEAEAARRRQARRA